MRTEYIYIAEPNGEIQYFLHNYGRRGKTKYYTRAEEAFGERSADLNLPVPYRPGDILKIDCSPYTDGVHYCILTEVGDDCCGVRCMYPVFDGRIGHGALKHGNYLSESACGIKQYLSPLPEFWCFTDHDSGIFLFDFPGLIPDSICTQQI